MGVQSELVIADRSEAEAVAVSDEPSRSWNGFAFGGLDHVQLIPLWALIESGSADNDLDARIDAVPVIPDSDKGPWVAILPDKMVTALSRIAALDEDEFQSLLGKWSSTEEFEGWDEADVSALLREVGDLADTARLEGKTLLLWRRL
jgi:hypothetical protein